VQDSAEQLEWFANCYQQNLCNWVQHSITINTLHGYHLILVEFLMHHLLVY